MAELSRQAAMLASAAVIALGFTGLACPLHRAHAASPERESAEPPRWHVAETSNFRIFNYGAAPLGDETGEACEALRGKLARQWLAGAEPTDWSPKCDVVLHPTERAYLGAVGGQGRDTVASALVDRRSDDVCLRRIDVRATRPDWRTAALPHELAHLVLADRFAGATLPRWVDEGVAILADPPQKRARHLGSLRQALARGTHFRLAELFALTDYPPADRWGAFYGQSASLVDYLVAQGGPEQFAEFVELALEHGYDRALEQTLGHDIGELERKWHSSLRSPSGAAAQGNTPTQTSVPPAAG